MFGRRPATRTQSPRYIVGVTLGQSDKVTTLHSDNSLTEACIAYNGHVQGEENDRLVWEQITGTKTFILVDTKNNTFIKIRQFN